MIDTNIPLDKLNEDIKAIISWRKSRDEKLLGICKMLRDNVTHYNWVGFYIVKSEGKLALGPYAGAPTDHIEIGFGTGVCGRAAEMKRALVVQDVSKETNYLSCNPNVRSEIVVPIMKNGEVVAELDIDSHAPSAFSEEDKNFLESVCHLLEELF